MDRLQESYIKKRVFLLNITRKIVKEESLAEDVVQDIYVKALSSEFKERLNSMTEEKLLCYLVTMLKHRAYNVMRKRNQEVDFSALYLEINLKEVDMADKTIDQVIFQQIKKELKNLPKEDEILIKLSYFYGFTNKEIAYALDLKESTVRKRLERARKRLEDLAKKYKEE